jgi:hypothetical protein
MPYVLCRLRNVEFSEVSRLLKEHAAMHAEEGAYLEQLWQNADDHHEAIFLFRVDDLERSRRIMLGRHEEARRKDPSANLPELIFLE